jgi:hypothetical protein
MCRQILRRLVPGVIVSAEDLRPPRRSTVSAEDSEIAAAPRARAFD